MTFPARPGVDTVWLAERDIAAGSTTSSFFVGAVLDRAGDAILSGRVLALSRLSAMDVGVPIRNRLLLRPAPFEGVSWLGLVAASGAGES